jgi:3,5-epimerase/4-reductase
MTDTITIGGGFVASHLPYPIIPEKLDLNLQSIKDVLSKYSPKVIVNCAGYTGKPGNVDNCEINKKKTSADNVALPVLLSTACEELGIRMVNINSGCIFYGKSSHEDGKWKETDFANPVSHYSKSKWACDLAIGGLPHVTTLRIRMPISVKNNPRNLINKLLAYPAVIDIENSMTFLDDLTRVVDWVIKENKSGIYHVTNSEPLTSAMILREYQKHVPSHKFGILTLDEMQKTVIAVRSNCLLNTDKLKNEGFVMSPTMPKLEQTMRDFIKNL